MKKYKVVMSTIFHNKIKYSQGMIIELDEKQAKRLEKLISPIVDCEPDTEKKVKIKKGDN